MAAVRLASPVQDFDLLALHAFAPQRYPVLLESLGNQGSGEHYDLLLALPQAALTSHGGRLQAQGWVPPQAAGFFTALTAWQQQLALPSMPADTPFCGGWFIYLGYEAARLAEPAVHWHATPGGLPDAYALRCAAAVVRRHASREMFICAESQDGAQQVAADVRRCAPLPVPRPRVFAVEEDKPEIFLAGVRRVLDYVQAGDAYQVNLSRGWRAPLHGPGDYLDLYRALRHHNPAPFAGLARLGNGATVLSSSPERLLRVQDGIVTTEPIAGTRPRHADPQHDAALIRALKANAKERAEHLMLIDLERNDLGRVCETGSIEVPELMAVHSHTHVHHIVSQVQGRLRAGVGVGDVLQAVFPGGTITGCPKVRVMQIIAELEQEGRGAYTGSMGYLSHSGRLDMNILIRTLVCAAGQVSLRAGAGIVADSDPDQELAETRAKARGLLLALEGAA
ncbi:MAG: aminodeoxychorismate synthase component I [Nevskiaceae bacterium]|nr:MAG: aminodeoxychorismate synthase component I [Nevskiaceae bacterium]TBR74896.1 MAG: aminodeoxychorismate synthase component I [Nevskiaceae bacterium]